MRLGVILPVLLRGLLFALFAFRAYTFEIEMTSEAILVIHSQNPWHLELRDEDSFVLSARHYEDQSDYIARPWDKRSFVVQSGLMERIRDKFSNNPFPQHLKISRLEFFHTQENRLKVEARLEWYLGGASSGYGLAKFPLKCDARPYLSLSNQLKAKNLQCSFPSSTDIRRVMSFEAPGGIPGCIRETLSAKADMEWIQGNYLMGTASLNPTDFSDCGFSVRSISSANLLGFTFEKLIIEEKKTELSSSRFATLMKELEEELSLSAKESVSRLARKLLQSAFSRGRAKRVFVSVNLNSSQLGNHQWPAYNRDLASRLRNLLSQELMQSPSREPWHLEPWLNRQERAQLSAFVRGLGEDKGQSREEEGDFDTLFWDIGFQFRESKTQPGLLTSIFKGSKDFELVFQSQLVYMVCQPGRGCEKTVHALPLQE